MIGIINYGSLSGYTVYRFNNVARKTTGKSESKLFTILPGFSMFLRNYAMFFDFKVRKLQSGWGDPACWGTRVPPRHLFPPAPKSWIRPNARALPPPPPPQYSDWGGGGGGGRH